MALKEITNIIGKVIERTEGDDHDTIIVQNGKKKSKLHLHSGAFFDFAVGDDVEITISKEMGLFGTSPATDPETGEIIDPEILKAAEKLRPQKGDGITSVTFEHGGKTAVLKARE